MRHLRYVLPLLLLSCTDPPDDREQDARTFVGKLGYGVLGASCTNMDSDGDGYVSCTVRVTGKAEPLAVECASRWAWLKSGCRLQKLSVRGQ